MKKLMIAAAAAAMISGAFAAGTATYQFAANLQTTTGASGYTTYTAYARYLGVQPTNATAFWYNDPGIDATTRVAGQKLHSSAAYTPAPGEAYTDLEWYETTSIQGKKYLSLKIVSADGTLTTAENAFLEYLENNYKKESAGVWCCVLSYSVPNPGRCYRVQGADAIISTLFLDASSCCSLGAYAFRAASGNPVIRYSYGTAFMNRFGAQTRADAQLIELFSPIEANTLYTYNTTLAYNGYLAGQGYGTKVACSDNAAIVYDIPVQISGMIVGYTDPTVCPDCCYTPEKTVAFNCYDADANLYPRTAAYGTFSITLTSLKQ